jgi:hypothetical protein
MRITTYLIAILLATLVGSANIIAAEEQVYRWVDENGVVHFGDRPNAEADAEVVKISKSPEYITPPQSADSSAAEPTYAQQLRDERAQKYQEGVKLGEELVIKCDYHSKMVAQLEPMTRVMVTQEDGSVTRMDDNDRLENLQVSKDFIAENCNK